jgi:outer membrane biosynthesis protein TonB
MLSKPAVVVAVVAVMCAVGAGTGAFLAVRQNASMPSAAAATLGDPGADMPAAPPQPALAPTSDTVVPVDDAAAEPPAKADKKDEAEPPEPKPVARKRARPRPAPEPIAPAPVPVTQPEPAPSAPAPDSSSSIEPVAPPPAVEYTPERREPIVERLVVSADAVIGLQMETTHTTELARLEDRAEARVARDVTVGDRTAIPAGARMIGSVTLVEKGGKVRERARLGVRFHTLVLADGTTVPLQTETIFREGDSPSKESAAKIGGAAVGGAILGAIFGGTKGAIIGGSTGAAGGTAAVMAGDRKPAMLNAGTGVTVRLSAPVTVMVERN